MPKFDLAQVDLVNWAIINSFYFNSEQKSQIFEMSNWNDYPTESHKILLQFIEVVKIQSLQIQDIKTSVNSDWIEAKKQQQIAIDNIISFFDQRDQVEDNPYQIYLDIINTLKFKLDPSIFQQKNDLVNKQLAFQATNVLINIQASLQNQLAQSGNNENLQELLQSRLNKINETIKISLQSQSSTYDFFQAKQKFSKLGKDFNAKYQSENCNQTCCCFNQTYNVKINFEKNSIFMFGIATCGFLVIKGIENEMKFSSSNDIITIQFNYTYQYINEGKLVYQNSENSSNSSSNNTSNNQTNQSNSSTSTIINSNTQNIEIDFFKYEPDKKMAQLIYNDSEENPDITINFMEILPKNSKSILQCENRTTILNKNFTYFGQFLNQIKAYQGFDLIIINSNIVNDYLPQNKRLLLDDLEYLAYESFFKPIQNESELSQCCIPASNEKLHLQTNENNILLFAKSTCTRFWISTAYSIAYLKSNNETVSYIFTGIEFINSDEVPNNSSQYYNSSNSLKFVEGLRTFPLVFTFNKQNSNNFSITGSHKAQKNCFFQIQLNKNCNQQKGQAPEPNSQGKCYCNKTSEIVSPSSGICYKNPIPCNSGQYLGYLEDELKLQCLPCPETCITCISKKLHNQIEQTICEICSSGFQQRYNLCCEEGKLPYKIGNVEPSCVTIQEINNKIKLIKLNELSFQEKIEFLQVKSDLLKVTNSIQLKFSLKNDDVVQQEKQDKINQYGYCSQNMKSILAGKKEIIFNNFNFNQNQQNYYTSEMNTSNQTNETNQTNQTNQTDGKNIRNLQNNQNSSNILCSSQGYCEEQRFCKLDDNSGEKICKAQFRACKCKEGFYGDLCQIDQIIYQQMKDINNQMLDEIKLKINQAKNQDRELLSQEKKDISQLIELLISNQAATTYSLIYLNDFVNIVEIITIDCYNNFNYSSRISFRDAMTDLKKRIMKLQQNASLNNNLEDMQQIQQINDKLLLSNLNCKNGHLKETINTLGKGKERTVVSENEIQTIFKLNSNDQNNTIEKLKNIKVGDTAFTEFPNSFAEKLFSLNSTLSIELTEDCDLNSELIYSTTSLQRTCRVQLNLYDQDGEKVEIQDLEEPICFTIKKQLFQNPNFNQQHYSKLANDIKCKRFEEKYQGYSEYDIYTKEQNEFSITCCVKRWSSFSGQQETLSITNDEVLIETITQYEGENPITLITNTKSGFETIIKGIYDESLITNLNVNQGNPDSSEQAKQDNISNDTFSEIKIGQNSLNQLYNEFSKLQNYSKKSKYSFFIAIIIITLIQKYLY